MKIFVGASSSENIPKEYVEDCKKLLEEILIDNDLVFGAYDKGLMGLSYEIAKKNNRSVTGICPEVYKKGLETLSCDKEELTTSIIDSTNKIYKNSDVILILPGGYGCIYELFTAYYCKICKEIDIPIILYNSCGYYNKLLEFIDDAYKKGLIKDTDLGHYFVANNPAEVTSYIANLN